MKRNFPIICKIVECPNCGQEETEQHIFGECHAYNNYRKEAWKNSCALVASLIHQPLEWVEKNFPCWIMGWNSGPTSILDRLFPKLPWQYPLTNFGLAASKESKYRRLQEISQRNSFGNCICFLSYLDTRDVKRFGKHHLLMKINWFCGLTELDCILT